MKVTVVSIGWLASPPLPPCPAPVQDPVALSGHDRVVYGLTVPWPYLSPMTSLSAAPGRLCTGPSLGFPGVSVMGGRLALLARAPRQRHHACGTAVGADAQLSAAGGCDLDDFGVSAGFLC